VGQKFTGQISHLVFVADDDGARVGQNVVFKPLVFKENVAIDQYDDVPAQRAFDDDVNGRGVIFTSSAVNNVQHNFHDLGDKDWTIIYAEDFKIRTELLGSNAQTKIMLYRWNDALYDGDLGYFTYVDDVLLDQSTDSWNTPLVNWGLSDASYAVKVESLNNNFGPGTEYKLIIEGMPVGSADLYDVPSSNGHTDDSDTTPTFWLSNSTEQVHNFHDNNDVDWTIVSAGSFTAFAQAMGEDADTKMTVYRWSSADYNNGVFSNIIRHHVGSDNNPGNSTVVVSGTGEVATYLIKVESRNGAFGNGTSYKLKLL
jgi:hypothetical protein